MLRLLKLIFSIVFVAQVAFSISPTRSEIDAQRVEVQSAMKRVDDHVMEQEESARSAMTTMRSSKPAGYRDPTSEEIEAQKENVRKALGNTDDILEEGYRLEGIIEEGRKNIKNISSGNTVGKIDLPTTGDVEAARKSMKEAMDEALKPGVGGMQAEEVPLIILISFSMSDSEIKSLLWDAASYPGSVVAIRGLIGGDFKKTINKIKSIGVDSDSAGITIDPTLFSRFGAEVVPTFILPLEGVGRCVEDPCKTPDHVRASGSISAEYFLRLIERTGTGPERDRAKKVLASVYGGVE